MYFQIKIFVCVDEAECYTHFCKHIVLLGQAQYAYGFSNYSLYYA